MQDSQGPPGSLYPASTAGGLSQVAEPTALFPHLRPTEWELELLVLLHRSGDNVVECLSSESQLEGFRAGLASWRTASAASADVQAEALFSVCREHGVIACLTRLGELPLGRRRVSGALRPAEGWAAADASPLVLEGAPPGLRAEIRWPVPGRREAAELVLIVDDWQGLGLDSGSVSRLGVAAVHTPPAEVPWSDWLRMPGPGTVPPFTLPLLQRIEEVANGQRSCTIQLTTPGADLKAGIREVMREWLRAGGLHVLRPERGN